MNDKELREIMSEIPPKKRATLRRAVWFQKVTKRVIYLFCVLFLICDICGVVYDSWRLKFLAFGCIAGGFITFFLNVMGGAMEQSVTGFRSKW